MSPLIWSILLLVFAIIFIGLETMMPSAGIMGILAAASVISSVVVAFQAGLNTGLTMLLVTLALLPVAIALALRIWPHTPIGRRLFMQRPKEEDVLPDSDAHRERQELLGVVGRAKTDLLPSGAVVIGGKTYEALSEGMAINSGAVIKVVALRTNRLVVKPASEAELVAAEPPPQKEAINEDDLLSKPLEDFGLDSLEDPIP